VSSSAPPAVILVRGDDASLVGQAAHDAIARLVGDGDHGLMVEEHSTDSESFSVGAVIDGCQTPPFLVDRRIVVVREAGGLVAADAKRLAEYLESPLESSSLVLVGGGGTVPAALVKAVKAAGDVVDTTLKTKGDRTQFFAEHLRHAPVQLEAPARERLGDFLGGEPGRLPGILETLSVAYGIGHKVTLAELEPFLGEAGTLAPWDLTDAIDDGRMADALQVLHRILSDPKSHPLVVMAQLHRHYRQMFRLDGAGIATPDQAAAFLGGSPFPARKALAGMKKLGTRRLARAISLLATADLDLRGSTMLPGETVVELLVARLSQMSRSRA